LPQKGKLDDKLVLQRLIQDYQTNESNFHHKYEEEVHKHEQTKKALNKAIKLANLLLEEITTQSECKKSDMISKAQSASGPHRDRLENQENNTPTQNYAHSLLSPTPVTEL